MMFQGGVINVLKPPGMTSHDVVSFVRRQYGQKRVGHAGTLDPAAAGVLPVFLGRATRLIEYFADADKGYRAEVILGMMTDTGDDTGKVLQVQPVEMPDRERLETILKEFLGVQEQVPPMYSAIKVGGKKMYELARAGVVVERKPRTIQIEKIALINLREQGFLFDVTCSKGTYIRTLCEDIGRKLECPAVMSFLVRTHVGAFSLEDACSLEEISAQPAMVLQPADLLLKQLPSIQLSETEFEEIIHGRIVALGDERCQIRGPVKMYDGKRQFVGIGQMAPGTNTGSVLKPDKIMFAESSSS